MMDCDFDAHLLLLDFPREDRCTAVDWDTTLEAFIAARRETGATASVVSSLSESLPERISERLIAAGISPMQGLTESLDAIRASAAIGAAHARLSDILPLPKVARLTDAPVRMLDEWASKQALANYGLPIPEGNVVVAEEAVACAETLGYPVVVKAVSESLAHKTEAGGVKLNLKNADEVRAAVAAMRGLSERFLVERMASNVIAELIIGVHRDPQFGLALTVGAGGILVELMKDAATMLLPASQNEMRAALASLKTWPLLTGYRGRAAGDIEAVLKAISAVARYAENHAGQLVELDVNPLLVLPGGCGVLAVDALIRLSN
jgi:acetyl-CoA synthetase